MSGLLRLNQTNSRAQSGVITEVGSPTSEASFQESINSSSNLSLANTISTTVFEGGDSEQNDQQQYDDEDQIYPEDEIDPDDPYQINRLNEIDHDVLKEMYTQVVDELLDLQLEFEEKLAEVED